MEEKLDHSRLHVTCIRRKQVRQMEAHRTHLDLEDDSGLHNVSDMTTIWSTTMWKNAPTLPSDTIDHVLGVREEVLVQDLD